MKPVDKKGVTYLNIENVSWKIIPSKFHIKMDNLFNGDKALGMLYYKIRIYYYIMLLSIKYIIDHRI